MIKVVWCAFENMQQTYKADVRAKMAILLYISEREQDAIHQVKKNKKLEDELREKDSRRPQMARPMKPKKNKWKKKKKH